LKVRLIPSKKIRKEFLLIYELEGAQKAIDFLAKYYKIKRMRIVLDGRTVARNYLAYYLENTAYFKNTSLKKRVVLHEFYHHLIHNNQILSKREEQEANDYARKMIK